MVSRFGSSRCASAMAVLGGALAISCHPSSDADYEWVAWHRQDHVIVGLVFSNKQRCEEFLGNTNPSAWPSHCIGNPIGRSGASLIGPEQPVDILYVWRANGVELRFFKESHCIDFKLAFGHGDVDPTGCDHREFPMSSRPKMRRLEHYPSDPYSSYLYQTSDRWRIEDANSGDGDLIGLEKGDYITVRWEGMAVAMFRTIEIAEDERSVDVALVCLARRRTVEDFIEMTSNPRVMDMNELGHSDDRIGYCWAEITNNDGAGHLELDVGRDHEVVPGHVFTVAGVPVRDNSPHQEARGTREDLHCQVPFQDELIRGQSTRCDVVEAIDEWTLASLRNARFVVFDEREQDRPASRGRTTRK